MTMPDSNLLSAIDGQPLAVGFSGGGDSLALVHMLSARAPKPLILIVDHALRSGSRNDAESAKNTAQTLGLKAEILTWSHENPTSGVQEKARQARYALLGEACRNAGIAHLAVGHTEDDQAETLLMRFDRNTDWRGAAGMRIAAHAQMWPQLAGITLHRPLLGASRQSLRNYNQHNGLTWFDDPSNQNRNFARIQARDNLAARPGLRQELLECARDLSRGRQAELAHFVNLIKRNVTISPQGIIHLRRPVPAALLQKLLRAAGGTGGPISGAKLSSLNAQIGKTDFSGATLAGAQIVPAVQGVHIGPDPSRFVGRVDIEPLEVQRWGLGAARLWNGRFWIKAAREDLMVEPLRGHITKLPPHLKASLKLVPPAFRGALPLVRDSHGEIVAIGGIYEASGAEITSAAALRLQGMLKGA